MKYWFLVKQYRIMIVNWEKFYRDYPVHWIEFLGAVISQQGVSISPKRIEAIRDFPAPKTKHDVQRFLGMINFVSKFIPNRAEMLKPIYDLLKKDSQFVWDEHQKQSFSSIKKHLISAVPLGFYCKGRETFVNTDASSHGLGAHLYQFNEDGEKVIISYDSRTLLESEKKVCSYWEGSIGHSLGLWKVRSFHKWDSHYHWNRSQPLVQILKTKSIDTLTPRLQKFRIRLMKYSYDMKYMSKDVTKRYRIAYLEHLLKGFH